MRLVGSASWQVRSDLPEALQFSGSVGEHAGFRLAPDQAPHQAPRDSTEAAWRLWWHRLLTHTFGLLMEQVAEEMPASSPAEHQARLREGAERAQREYGPPTFPELAHSSDLQRLCRQEWPPFLAGGGASAARSSCWSARCMRNSNASGSTASCARALSRQGNPRLPRSFSASIMSAGPTTTDIVSRTSISCSVPTTSKRHTRMNYKRRCSPLFCRSSEQGQPRARRNPAH